MLVLGSGTNGLSPHCTPKNRYSGGYSQDRVNKARLFPKLTPMVLGQCQVTPPTQQDTQVPLGLTEENNPEKGTSYKSDAGGQQEA